MRLSQNFIDYAEKHYGWANDEVRDFTPRKVRLAKGTKMSILKDEKGHLFLDRDGNEETLAADTFVDASSAAVALAMQLTSVDPRVHAVIQQTAHYKEDMTVNSTDCQEGASNFMFKQVSFTAQSTLIGDDGETKSVEIIGESSTFVNKNYGLHYSVTRKELRAAVLMGTPLRSQKSLAVVKGIEAKSNEIAYIGDADFPSETGLLNDALSTNTQAANNAAVSSRNWADKTNAEIITDGQTMYDVIFSNSDGEVIPNKLILPPSLKGRMMVPWSAANAGNVTLEKMFSDTYGVKIVYRTQAETIGTGSSCLACMYNDSSMYLEFVEGMAMRSYPENMTGLKATVDSEVEVVGTVIYVPMAVTYMYGI